LIIEVAQLDGNSYSSIAARDSPMASVDPSIIIYAQSCNRLPHAHRLCSKPDKERYQHCESLGWFYRRHSLGGYRLLPTVPVGRGVKGGTTKLSIPGDDAIGGIPIPTASGSLLRVSLSVLSGPVIMSVCSL
jgi:hypothetical protein